MHGGGKGVELQFGKGGTCVPVPEKKGKTKKTQICSIAFAQLVRICLLVLFAFGFHFNHGGLRLSFECKN
jgi:hypothetical protein